MPTHSEMDIVEFKALLSFFFFFFSFSNPIISMHFLPQASLKHKEFEQQEIVVLLSVLSHEINHGYQPTRIMKLTSLNGVDVSYIAIRFPGYCNFFTDFHGFVANCIYEHFICMC